MELWIGCGRMDIYSQQRRPQEHSRGQREPARTRQLPGVPTAHTQSHSSPLTILCQPASGVDVGEKGG